MESVKHYLKKLKTTSLYRTFLNNYFIVAFFVLLFMLAINHYICIIPLAFYSIYIIKKEKKIFILSILISLVIIVIFLFLESKTTYQNLTYIKGRIINVEEKENYTRITVKKSIYKVYLYDYDKKAYTIGNEVEAYGESLSVSSERIPNAFDYQEYLKHQKIIGIIKIDSIKITDKSFRIGSIKTYFLRYLNLYDDTSKMYLKALILGNDDDFSLDLSNAIRDNGISHLFAISGLHIGLLVALLKKLLTKAKMKEEDIEKTTIIILVLYLVLTSFSASILRSSLMYFLYIINKKYNLGLSSLDVISIVFILLVIVNPYYMYSLGFVLSFSVATMIILVSPLLINKTNYMQILYISLFSQIFTFPVIINQNHTINLLSPIGNVFFITIVSSFILPFTFLTLIIYPLSFIYSAFMKLFSKLTIVISQFLIIDFSFPSVSIYFTLLYYVFIYLFVKTMYKKKIKYLFLSLLSILIALTVFKSDFTNKTEVYFLDVYNGDSIFINDTCNNCKALIDTGDGDNQEVTKFLKSKGIRKLDYLILTHNHDDHNGEASNIIKEIKVDKIVTSIYDSSIFKDKANSINLKKGDSFKCGNIIFHVLHPDKLYDDENDNSLVLYAYIGEYYFLFTADASKNVEEKLPSMNVDVLKVAHHGSATSTSLSFLKKMKPEIAVIMTTRIKMFNFPRKQTIDNLQMNNITIYRTDLDYTIIYKYYKKKSIFVVLNDNNKDVH